MSIVARIAAILATILCLPAAALAGFSFKGIDGGTIDLDGYRGHPVLVVNTASLCAFSGQYADLQALQNRYGARGLVVLAVPSNDFNQELPDEKAVKSYCAANFDLTLPMTEITSVKGPQAHPFYAWLKADHGFQPGWNFNKVLLGPQGEVVETWGSMTKPTATAITARIEPLLH